MDRLEQSNVKTYCLGGSAVYSAIALTRLGHAVQVWSQVGTDFDRSLLDELQRDDILWRLKVAQGPNAKIHLVYDSAGHISQFGYEPGVGRLLHVDALGEGFWVSTCVWLGTGPPDYQLAVARKAVTHGQAVYLSPQGDYKGEFGAFSRLLPYLSGIFLNQREARELCGDTLERAVARLCEGGQHLLCVITCGERGALLAWGENLYRVNACPQPMVNATGAGDAFAASFVHRFLAGVGPAESLAFASVAAAMSLRAFAYRAIAAEQQVLTELARRRQQIKVGRASLDSAKARKWLKKGGVV